MEKIAIIVPVWNTNPQYLRDTIDSVIKQDCDRWTCIIVDDGSTNKETLECLEEYKELPKIEIHHTSNRGPSYARLMGVKLSEEKYVTFLDSDDILHRSFIRICLKELNDEFDMISVNIKMYSSEKELVNLENQTIGERYEKKVYQGSERIMGGILGENDYPRFYSTASCVYKRNLFLQEVHSRPIFRAEDQLYNAEYLTANSDCKVKCIELPLYFYNRMNQQSITHTINARNLTIADAMDALYEVTKKRKFDSLENRAGFNACVAAISAVSMSTKIPEAKKELEKYAEMVSKYAKYKEGLSVTNQIKVWIIVHMKWVYKCLAFWR